MTCFKINSSSYINEESGDTICLNHYLKSLVPLPNYTLLSSFLSVFLTEFQLFEVRLIKVKAWLSVLKTNKQEMRNVEELEQKIEELENEMELRISRIIKEDKALNWKIVKVNLSWFCFNRNKYFENIH